MELLKGIAEITGRIKISEIDKVSVLKQLRAEVTFAVYGIPPAPIPSPISPFIPDTVAILFAGSVLSPLNHSMTYKEGS